MGIFIKKTTVFDDPFFKNTQKMTLFQRVDTKSTSFVGCCVIITILNIQKYSQFFTNTHINIKFHIYTVSQASKTFIYLYHCKNHEVHFFFPQFPQFSPPILFAGLSRRRILQSDCKEHAKFPENCFSSR